MLQSELRKLNKNSSHIVDFSINKTDDDNNNGRKTHFFLIQILFLIKLYLMKVSIDLKIEKVSNDNYMDLYSLEGTSPIIKDTNVLESIIEFSGYRDDLYLDLSLETMKQ